MGRHGGAPEEGQTEGRRLLPKGMYNFYEETIQDKETLLEGDEGEVSEGRRLPREMYNFYNMDQYQTSPLEEARHKDFDIWLQDFDEQVSRITTMHMIGL